MDARLIAWRDGQRALARTLGLSLEGWLLALDAAAERRTGLYAAVVGAAMAERLGLGVLDELDGPALARRARELVDPRPPRVADPILAEAIRRAEELPLGRGAARLQAKPAVESAPARQTGSLGDSAKVPTADAPGEET